MSGLCCMTRRSILERYSTQNDTSRTERLSADVQDPTTITFGFGRRHFAVSTLFIYIASILHTLDISPPLDERGRPIRIEVKATTSAKCHVRYRRLEDCRCSIKPRSATAEALIRRTVVRSFSAQSGPARPIWRPFTRCNLLLNVYEDR
ncbi:hypothetical protein C8Q80DRAFT_386659 [Daedaleopsis nitida]|nr:hypothetical protein C8Q80DRAFT_386659 [Daedaleopsis nitida]